MGITTEFLYKIYPRPETLPCLAFIFVENGEDLKGIEKAAKDPRYQISLYATYVFRDMSIKVWFYHFLDLEQIKFPKMNIIVGSI